VLAVVEFEKIDSRNEQLLGLPEADAMRLDVAALLLRVPFEPHLAEV
jgi:hypothetical protein